ncbi:hypothetical protein J6590_007401 [Homalodisca vitripennis]|nr:hypothetical protein J6590_007401 [Homalodisca vitripennis]
MGGRPDPDSPFTESFVNRGDLSGHIVPSLVRGQDARICVIVNMSLPSDINWSAAGLCTGTSALYTVDNPLSLCKLFSVYVKVELRLLIDHREIKPQRTDCLPALVNYFLTSAIPSSLKAAN